MLRALLILPALLATPLLASTPVATVVADPAAIELVGPGARKVILIHGKDRRGKQIDLTNKAKWRSLDPTVARVTGTGTVHALSDGSTTIEITVAGRKLQLTVQTKHSQIPRRFNFENDLIPLLSRHGCNSSGCHGKAEGQNGFKLSVFGFDPPADFRALTRQGRGRRVFFAAPDQSLLLRKISGGLPHGGGKRLEVQSEDYRTIRDWIAAGAPFGSATDPKVVNIRVEPQERLLGMRATQQLRVTALWSNGNRTDVTEHAEFHTNREGVATVSPSGLVTARDVPGQVAIMAGYMGCVSTFQAMIPRDEPVVDFPRLPENNFIDRLVFARLRKLNIKPSDPATDSDYLRRVYLDIIGTLPTPVEAREFFQSKQKDKRARLVEALLDRPEMASLWALQWSDLLRVDRQALGHKQAYAYYRWIRESVATNKPVDQFAAELITAEGPLQGPGPGYFYKVIRKPGEQASALSMALLGARIACAECHHHPFDQWSQTDYQGMKSYFTQVRVQKAPRGEVLFTRGDPVSKHPRTGKPVHAYPLGGAMPESMAKGDRRPALATWLTSPKNPWFAKNLANRVWAHFMGRGLVEPVDDVRLTNPPTNPELLNAMAGYLVEKKFNLHALIRLITASQAYQLSAKPNETNEKDETSYSRASLKRPGAEVLLDMVCRTTGVPEKYSGFPTGTRAIDLWDSQVRHDFLTLFGRPVRSSTCECERSAGTNVRQVLHFLNSPRVQRKLSHGKGTVARLVRKYPQNKPLVEELYLTFYSRYPTVQEKAVASAYLKENQSKRRQAVEDLAWTMLNSLEFVFNH